MNRPYNVALYTERRNALMQLCKQEGKTGIIAIFAGFERECTVFRQESSFYYYTGIREPGLVMVLDLRDESSTLYIPNCGAEREKWVLSPVPLSLDNAASVRFTNIAHLGDQCVGYQFHPFFPRAEYGFLLAKFQECVASNNSILTLAPNDAGSYVDQRLILSRLAQFIPGIEQNFVDISHLVARMRRKKDMVEIELLYKAIEITAMAQEVAAQTIAPGVTECEVQAGLEYIFIGSCARPSFPSIVATGKNSTILHYTLNNATLAGDDMVVVDIGAEYENYCADITRTYPVSGKFTARQKELYTLVLETQEYIAALAQPGYWLSNREQPEKSLNHLAKKYLDERGYGNYFPHGIGHFLGLDVHDVGDRNEPLQPGDVITIEPGIYISEEKIGIRIEDDYWIVEDGAVCLSDYIPKGISEIEFIMREKAAERKG